MSRKGIKIHIQRKLPRATELAFPRPAVLVPGWLWNVVPQSVHRSNDLRWLRSDQSFLESNCVYIVSLNLILLSRFSSLSGKNSFLPFLSMGQLGLHVGVPGGRFGRESLSCDALAKDSLADPWEPWYFSESSLHPPCTHQALGMDCIVGTMTLGKWLSAAAAILKRRICQLWAVGLLLPAPLSGQHWREMWAGLASARHSPAPGPEITRLKSLCL